ncbi:MAG: 4Fe-4S dicluster domain-containing protein [Campylobacterales bacterium]
MLLFDRYLCLISDHMGAPCRACIDICPTGAFSVKGGRIRFEEPRCTACGGCVGGCPTEAMALEGFDEDHFALVFSQSGQTRLSCRENTPCLAVFGAEHLAVMALRGKGEIVCDLAHCEGCEHNRDNRLQAQTSTQIQTANGLLEELGFAPSIGMQSAKTEGDRRGFFKKLFHTAVKTAVRSENEHKPVDSAVTPVPKRRILLQNTLAGLDFAKLGALKSPLIADRAVSDACTACGECVRICPTRALSWADGGAALTLQADRCVDCELCAGVCKPGAIIRPETIDARAYVRRESKTLKTFTFIECDTCGTPFAALPGVRTCEPCRAYAQDFGDMFTPAWKLEQS